MLIAVGPISYGSRTGCAPAWRICQRCMTFGWRVKATHYIETERLGWLWAKRKTELVCSQCLPRCPEMTTPNTPIDTWPKRSSNLFCGVTLTDTAP